MNPQVVCSVAGLCNNDRVHKLLAEEANIDKTVGSAIRDRCQDCHTVVGLAEEKFNKLSRDEVLQHFLMVKYNYSNLYFIYFVICQLYDLIGTL